MLPPVHAALSSNIDFQSQPQVAANRARVEVSASALQQDSEKSAAISAARSDAMSLSAQLKLAQGSSIFAETIGKLLKTPRRENETLIDYTARLFQAVQALKPSEVANVERLLNQIVKGISLRILAEVLREPSGPAAARLAVYIETASIAERDLARNAVVSSYRQNAGADTTPAGSGVRVPVNGNMPATNAPSPASPGTSTGSQAGTATESQAMMAAPKGEGTDTGRSSGVQSANVASATQGTSIAGKAGDSLTNHANTAPAGGSSPLAEKSASLDGPLDKPSGQTSTANAASSSTPPASQAKPEQTAALVTARESLPLPTNNQLPSPAPGAAVPPVAVATDGPDADVDIASKLQEAAALIQAADDGQGDDMPVPARLWTSLSDQTVAKLASWAAAIVDNAQAPAPGQISATAAAQLANAEDGIDMQQTGGIPVAKGMPAGLPQQIISDAASNGQAAADARAATMAAPRDVTEQSLAAASATIQAPVRESPPWPYVAAYPPAEEERKRQQRKTPPIEAIEDEEQGENTEQYAFGEEEQDGEPQDDADPRDEIIAGGDMTSAEKAAGYMAGEAYVEGGISEPRPSDLYWRMAGWN